MSLFLFSSIIRLVSETWCNRSKGRWRSASDEGRQVAPLRSVFPSRAPLQDNTWRQDEVQPRPSSLPSPWQVLLQCRCFVRAGRLQYVCVGAWVWSQCELLVFRWDTRMYQNFKHQSGQTLKASEVKKRVVHWWFYSQTCDNMDIYCVYVADGLILCRPPTPQEINDPFPTLFTFLKVS